MFTDVVSGLNHFIDVRHTNGCIKRTPSFDITSYEPLSLVLENGGLNEIVAIATGGSGDYEFTINGADQLIGATTRDLETETVDELTTSDNDPAPSEASPKIELNGNSSNYNSMGLNVGITMKF